MSTEDDAKKILATHFGESKNAHDESDMFGFGKLGDILTQEESILMHSIISGDMPTKIALLTAIDSKIKSPIIQIYINTLLKANVSVKGSGRKDIIKLSQSIASAIQATMSKEGGILDRFKKG